MLDFLSFLPCCGPRKRDEKDNTTTDESATLIPPRRPDSILSADGSTNQPLGYGAVDQQPQGLTGEQRRRIEAIGREVGNQMLPIHTLQNRSKSPSRRTPTPSRANATHLAHHGSASTSPTSSRPSSPSPMRPGTSPPNNTLSPPGHHGRTGTDGTEDEGGDDGVVRKQLFAGGLTVGGDRSRRGSARGGRGRGRGKPRGK